VTVKYQVKYIQILMMITYNQNMIKKIRKQKKLLLNNQRIQTQMKNLLNSISETLKTLIILMNLIVQLTIKLLKNK